MTSLLVTLSLLLGVSSPLPPPANKNSGDLSEAAPRSMEEAGMEMNTMDLARINLEKEDSHSRKEGVEMQGFLPFPGLRSRYSHFKAAKSNVEGSGLEGSAAGDSENDGSGDAEGSGFESSGFEGASELDLIYDGSGSEGSGEGGVSEGSGAEGSGSVGIGSESPEAGASSQMPPTSSEDFVLLPPAPLLDVSQASSDIRPPELLYPEPVSYDGASYPIVPESILLPDTAGETAPHVVYPEPAASLDLAASQDTGSALLSGYLSSSGLASYVISTGPWVSSAEFAAAETSTLVFASDLGSELVGSLLNAELPPTIIISDFPARADSSVLPARADSSVLPARADSSVLPAPADASNPPAVENPPAPADISDPQAPAESSALPRHSTSTELPLGESIGY